MGPVWRAGLGCPKCRLGLYSSQTFRFWKAGHTSGTKRECCIRQRSSGCLGLEELDTLTTRPRFQQFADHFLQPTTGCVDRSGKPPVSKGRFEFETCLFCPEFQRRGVRHLVCNSMTIWDRCFHHLVETANSAPIYRLN